MSLIARIAISDIQVQKIPWELLYQDFGADYIFLQEVDLIQGNGNLHGVDGLEF